MKTKLLAVMLLAGGSMFAQTRFSVGVGFGGQGDGSYQAPPSYASDIPPCPGPDYYWVDGYWSQDHGRNTWIAGYWTREQFNVAPHFDNRFNDRDNGRGSTRAFDQEQTAVLARVETSVGRIATKPVDSIKASRAILGGIKPRIRTLETATGPAKTRVVKVTVKKRFYKRIQRPLTGFTNRLVIRDEPAAQATGFPPSRT